jgi:dipeptidyl aminopeptidase/acylaminoacyl peptidase
VGAALAVLVLLLAVAAALVAFAWRASNDAVGRGVGAYDWTLADYPGLQPEEVKVKSRTGVELAARFFPGRSRATIVLSHGYSGTQDELLPVASALHEAGFSVFSYDLRGCGGSGGEITFGDRERDDLRSVVDYVASRDDVDAEKIGALGYSMGAATTLMTAAHDGRIKAVVADSGWSDVYSWLRPKALDVFVHPRHRFTPLSMMLIEWRTGVDFDDLKPVREIGAIAPRPLLLIHGTADDSVLPGDSDENFAAAREPKELWRIDGAGHGETLEPGGPTSSRRVVEFFQRALAVA